MPSDLRFRAPDGMVEIRAAAIIVRRPTPDPADARLLMVTNQADDFAYSVGGALELGETSREAVLREVREETGMDLPIGPLAAIEQSFHIDRREFWHLVTFHYWVDVLDGFEPWNSSVGFRSSSETLHWYGLDDLSRLTFHPRFYRDALFSQWDGIRSVVERRGETAIQTLPAEAEIPVSPSMPITTENDPAVRTPQRSQSTSV